MVTLKKKTVKMNITLDWDFYQLLKQHAANDFIKVATWTKHYLMKSLVTKNKNADFKCETKNGREM